MPLSDLREDRLLVSLPRNQYFRLEDSTTYTAVSALALTEVDFAWMSDEDGALWLMELKDYGRDRPDVSEVEEKLGNQLPKNIAHAVLLISAAWADTPFGRKLKNDIENTFPGFPEQAVPIRAVAVIHADGYDVATIGSLTDAVDSALSPFDLETVAVLPASSNRVEDELGIQIRYDPE